MIFRRRGIAVEIRKGGATQNIVPSMVQRYKRNTITVIPPETDDNSFIQRIKSSCSFFQSPPPWPDGIIPVVTTAEDGDESGPVLFQRKRD